MRPRPSLLTTVGAMFRDLWNGRLSGFEIKRIEQKKALTGVKTKISKLTDRLIETTSTSAIKAYEVKLDQLET